MKTFKSLFAGSIILALGLSLITSDANGQTQAKPWIVPAKDKSMVNPIAKSDASIAAGKTLYAKTCAACHGKTGLGDGPKAKSLKTGPGNFCTTQFQSQTDGEHFYKTKTGRGEMTKYEGKLSDDDIWNIVNYMRTFKK